MTWSKLVVLFPFIGAAVSAAGLALDAADVQTAFQNANWSLILWACAFIGFSAWILISYQTAANKASAALQEIELAAVADQLPHVAHLRTIPGIGLLNATALVACVGDVRRFPSGRHFASYLGLTPREHSSGNCRRLGAISKQGDRYLRTLLMHGARALLAHSRNPAKTTPFRIWIRTLAARRGANIATAAIANRLARMVWRVWHDDRPFVAEARVAA